MGTHRAPPDSGLQRSGSEMTAEVSQLRSNLRARKFLLEAETIRRSLFELARSRQSSKETENLLSYLLEIATDSALPSPDLEDLREIRNRLIHGGELDASQLATADRTLDRLRESLKELVSVPARGRETLPSSDRLAFLKAAAFIDSQLGRRASRNRVAHMREVEQFVFSNPGHFILDICQRLNSPIPHPGFSYSSVWLYVQRLVNRRRVLTVGGPRGQNRYCFPHPDALPSWEPYYGRSFAIEARLERKLTDLVDFSRSRKWVDIYEANSIMRRRILLIADLGRLRSVEGGVIRSFGTLRPFAELSSALRVRPLGALPRRDILVASGVDRVRRDGREEHVWSLQDVTASLQSSFTVGAA